MKKILILPTLIFVMLAVGCNSQVMSFDGNVKRPTAAAKEVGTDIFFIGGIAQQKIHDAGYICGGGDKVHSVETKNTFLNGLVSFFTFGIVTPKVYAVHCK